MERRARRRAAAAVVVLLALVGPPAGAGGEEETFPLKGEVSFGPDSPLLVGLDPGLRRLVGVSAQVDGKAYSVSADGGKPDVKSIETGLGPLLGALDAQGHRLFVAGSDPLTGQVGIATVDLRKWTVGPLFTSPNLGPPNLSIAVAMGFAPSQNRLYVTTDTGQTPMTNVTVFAFDADKLQAGSSDAITWSYQIPVCGYMPPASLLRPPFISYSPSGGFVYFACSGGDRGMSGAVRLHLGPAPEDTGRFNVEFFPFAGDFSNGIVSGDPVGERLIFVVTAAGPKMYVFDAARAMWTGSAALESDSATGGSVDPTTGRVYIVLKDRGVLVTDGAAVRVPQGRVYRLVRTPSGSDAYGHPVFDPLRHMLWVKVGKSWFANEDRIPPAVRPEFDDPDEFTSPALTEVPGRTWSTFSGSARAFGARELLVGGYQSSPAYSSAPLIFDQLPARSGQRDLIFGHVVDANLGDSGGAAKAAGWSPDQNTRGDLQGAEPIAGPAREQGVDAGHASGMDLSHCGAFSGAKAEDERQGSGVFCNSDAQAVTAWAESPPGASGLVVRVGYARASAEIRKTADQGTVATARSIARHVEIPGVLSIGEVSATVTSVAHGTMGTAKTTVQTTIDDVVILSPIDGKRTVFSCGYGTGPDCKSPDDVAAAINRILQPHVRAVVPRHDGSPPTFGSPGGAKAAFVKDPYQDSNDVSTNQDEQKPVAALELTFYNDGARSSRLVVQLAAASTDANYTVNPVDEGTVPLPTLPPLPRPIPTTVVLGAGPYTNDKPPPSGPTVIGERVPPVIRQIARGLAFVITKPGESLLLAGVWALLGIPVYLASRRRMLALGRRGS